MLDAPRVFIAAHAAAFGALASVGVLAAPAWAQPSVAPDGFANLVEQVGPAVVNIRARQSVSGAIPRFAEGSPLEKFNEYFQGPQGSASAAGSGFIIDADGVVITNNHVIAPFDEAADIIEVVLPDGRVLPGDIAGRDEETDLAVIRVSPEEPLPEVPFGDPSDVRVGDWVMAIGNPFGLGNTVTVGVVSAQDRDINQGDFDSFIQTDAAINQGNSGGPLFDMQGRVIGVNTAIFSPSGGSVGIGFAIPADLVQNVTGQLLDAGAVRRGWIGVRIQPVDAGIARKFGLGRPRGALVSGVSEDGPAEAAGLAVGDLIVGVSGGPVRDDRAFSLLIAQTAPGAEITLDVLREGAPQSLTLTVGEREQDDDGGPRFVTPDAPLESGGAALVIGVTVAPMTPDIVRQYRVAPEAEGVVVTFVEPESAASAVLVPGDVIEQVGWTPVATPEEAAAAALEEAEAGAPVLVRVTHRNGEVSFHSIRAMSAP